MRIARLEAPAGERFAGARLFFEAGKFERAAVAITEVLDEDPGLKGDIGLAPKPMR